MTRKLCPMRRFKGDLLKVKDADMFLECVGEQCSWFNDDVCAITGIDISLSSIADDISMIMSKYKHSDDVYEE